MSLALVREPGQDYDAPGNKHDTGYKYLLSRKATFVQFLRTFIAADWVKDVDVEDVTLIPRSFILQDFCHQEADMVYKLRLAGQDVYFYLLLELQSTVDSMMPFRLLMYMVEIWRHYWFNEVGGKGSFSLPAIVPCVLYNGKGNWTAGTSFGRCQAGFALFKKHALDFNYILIDVNRYDKEQLLALGNLMGSVFYMEQCRGIDEVLQGLSQLAAVLDRMPEEEVQRFSAWAGKVVIKGMSDQQRQKVLDLIRRKGGKTLITNFERIIQETWRKYRIEGMAQGRAEGLALGREEGILEGKKLTARNALRMGLAPEQVARLAELSLAEVLQLREELGN